MSTHNPCTDNAFVARRLPFGQMLSNLLIEALWRWPERARQRRHLAAMDDRQLRDIGLTRGEVDDETRKPFWKR
ncbi:MAG: DUF1127 domain-containing protein [Azospirillaceae bacterium]